MEQRSPEWFADRCGRVTASRVAHIATFNPAFVLSLIERAQAAEARARTAEEALYWALGEGPEDDFPSRGDGEGAFWWRKELRRRCGLPVRITTTNPSPADNAKKESGSTDWMRGREANLADLPRNHAESTEWLRGWDDAQYDRALDLDLGGEA